GPGRTWTSVASRAPDTVTSPLRVAPIDAGSTGRSRAASWTSSLDAEDSTRPSGAVVLDSTVKATRPASALVARHVSRVTESDPAARTSHVAQSPACVPAQPVGSARAGAEGAGGGWGGAGAGVAVPAGG